MKFIKIKSHLNISFMYPLGKEILTNKKYIISKGLWKQGSNLTFQKFITTIWLEFHKKKFTFNFMISFFNPY
jgi:hypothetical protein